MHVHFFESGFDFGEAVAKLLFQPLLDGIRVLLGQFAYFILVYCVEF